MMKHSFLFLSLAAIGLLSGCSKGTQQDFVAKLGEPIYIQCDTVGVEPVVKTALDLLAHDFATVLDAELRVAVTLDSATAQGHAIVMGNETLEGREHFCLEAKDGNLTLNASDAHGLAYGLLELSRLMGVSPWEWWADATARKQKELRIAEGTRIDQKPDVPFRGIFINDEDWGLMLFVRKMARNMSFKTRCLAIVEPKSIVA